MKGYFKKLTCAFVCLWLSHFCGTHAEEFNISVGDTISAGVPAQGAGRLASAQEQDFYAFTATSGQLVFAEPLDLDDTFKNNLRWQLIKPNGQTVFSSFFYNPQGRTLLPDAGVYKIRVFTDGSNPAWTGAYSFRLLPIPPDQTFPLNLGEQVSDGVPVAGAGRLEVPGAEDSYTFNASAGQLVFFEPLTQASAFQRNLRWQLTRPNGQSIFSSFFSNPQGRTFLPETGQYKLRIFTSGTDARWFGDYSFRTQPVIPDQTFAYTVGSTVTNGFPAAGAGLLEQAGSEDNYTFSGSAGQIIFFESLSQAEAFRNNLRWQLIRPNGQTVFSSFFNNTQGRTLLPESGQYRIRIFTDGTTATWFGPYSFKTRGDITDNQIAIRIGDVISDGQPIAGAGRIEAPGAEDTYTFTARAGAVATFESLDQAENFARNLRWQLLKPNGQTLFSSFFYTERVRRIIFPEDGTYRVRIFTDGTNPDWTGAYSFRSYTQVWPGRDNATTLPGRPVFIATAKLLFNDKAEDTNDTLRLSLPNPLTAEGGTVTATTNGVLYTPKAAFTGIDRFTYRLHGNFGGTNDTIVNVAVIPEADAYATVVNFVRRDIQTVEICFLGVPGTNYEVQSSSNYEGWKPIGTVAESADHKMIFPFQISTAPKTHFFRAPVKP